MIGTICDTYIEEAGGDIETWGCGTGENSYVISMISGQRAKSEIGLWARFFNRAHIEPSDS